MLGLRLGLTRRLAALLLPAVLASLLACGANRTSTNPAGPSAARPSVATAPAQVTPAAAVPPLPADATLLAVVNKSRTLNPPSSTPPDLVPLSPEFTSSLDIQRLRRPAAEALTQLLSAARKDGMMIKVNSAYRSYDYQATVLRAEIAAYGCAQAIRQVAAPGHSEHQLGLAADLTAADVGWDLSDRFGQMPEGRWLAAHAATYGFVLSYPEGKENVTGYIAEPWHYRYVTPPVAQAIQLSSKTPSEYLLGLGGAADTGVERSAASVPAGFGCP